IQEQSKTLVLLVLEISSREFASRNQVRTRCTVPRKQKNSIFFFFFSFIVSRLPDAPPRPLQRAVHRRRAVGREHGELPLAVARPLPDLGHREAVALAAGPDPLPLAAAPAAKAGRVRDDPSRAPHPLRGAAVAVPPVDGHLQAGLGEHVLVGAHGVAPPGVQAAAAAARVALLRRHNAAAVVLDVAGRPGRALELAEADGEHRALPLPPPPLVEQEGRVAAAVVGREHAAAERAGGVGEQPGVDAVDVERVAAQRQQPQPVVAGELAQAHRAVERLLGARADHHLPVEEHRQRVDDGLVQPGVVQVEQLLQLPLQRRLLPSPPASASSVHLAAPILRRPGARAGAPPQEPDQQVQQAGDEHERRQHQHHDQDHRANPQPSSSPPPPPPPPPPPSWLFLASSARKQQAVAASSISTCWSSLAGVVRAVRRSLRAGELPGRAALLS
uniref:Uncharacterized protein n=1 Tax=Triticum urartu TaxID=4572 RepID=A0A8R7R0V1_TRIUA